MTDHDFETEVPVRFRDVDAMGHVNNAVYATYFEEARAAYFREVIGVELSAVDSVLASLSIDFHAPVTADDRLTVGVSVPDLGESSIPMEYEVRKDDGTLAATGETVQVAYDRETGESRSAPDAWREAIGSA
ncbi:acyl-CoA thioesterase [Halobacteriales archaeon QS_1_68_20]|nr:MAG: acyl-CoA thioesterase [Halobacteriales archaeon QS_1_68_20]